MTLHRRIVWLIQSGITSAVYDAAVSLPEAKRRAGVHLELDPNSLKWAQLDSGHINGFSEAFERVVVVIVPYHLESVASLEDVLQHA